MVLSRMAVHPRHLLWAIWYGPWVVYNGVVRIPNWGPDQGP